MTALAGRLPSLDKLAKDFLAAEKSVRNDLVAQAKKLAADINDQASAIYLRTFDKLQENEGYVKKELTRISKLLDKKATLANKKVDDLQVKQNSPFDHACYHYFRSLLLIICTSTVLHAFDETKEKADEAKDRVKEEL